MDPRQWRLLIESGQLVMLDHGVYAQTVAPSGRLRLAQRTSARLLNLTDHLALSASALAIHDLPNPYFRAWDQVPVTIGGPRSRRQTGVVRSRLDPVESPWGPVSSLIDTAGTIAAELPLPQALMVTDAVARMVAGTRDRHQLAAEGLRHEVRRRLARDWNLPAMAYANPAVESPAESFCRGHMLIAGYPEPQCGVPVRGASGAQYYADLVLGQLIIEVDGRLKYLKGRDLIEEKIREDDLRAAGWWFHRVLVDDLFVNPTVEMRKLQTRALALPA